MNSIEALDFAVARLRRSTSWGRSPGYAEEATEAIRTLEALREHIADQEETRSRERAILDDWVGHADTPLAATWRPCANCGHSGPHTPDSGCSLCECPSFDRSPICRWCDQPAHAGACFSA
jgi:hypothetical protein